MEISAATHAGSPLSTHIMPNTKLTDTYPRQMGSPSFAPFQNGCFTVTLPQFFLSKKALRCVEVTISAFRPS